MSKPCELCGHAGPMRPFYADRAIVQCPLCELVFYEKAAVAEALYTREYFAGGEYADYVADKDAIQRNFRRRVGELRRLAPGGALFEIGAAYGFFLELARRHWQVRGVEIAPEAAAHARDVLNLDVRDGDFLDLPDEPARYDVICLWDTIEHLMHPVRAVEKASRWLKPGGYLVVTTGDIASRVARWRKSRWRLIHPPTHMYYFSPRTLGRAAARAGLTVRRVSHVGYSRSSRSMLYAMTMLGARKRPLLYRVLTAGERVDVPVYLNLYDIMLLIAQKSGEPASSVNRRGTPA